MDRRTALRTMGIAAGAVAAGTAAEPARASGSAYAPALPTVDMEAVLKSAQWDPVKVDQSATSGSGPSVTLVEQALQAKGLLAAGLADGHFGTSTITAYAAWQRQLGYSGLGANGMPGSSSLATLGQGRFTLVRPVSPGGRLTYRGYPMNARTKAMLLEAERRWGRTFTITQGSYSPGVDPTSVGTHDGGGVLDLDAVTLTTAQRTAAAKALREVGFAAWVRNPSQDDWPWHLHAVAISDTDLATQARTQVGRYYEGRNGLAGNGPDDGPAVTKVTWEQYLRARG